MAAKMIISIVVGILVAAVVWGILYDQTHSRSAQLNRTLDALAGNYDNSLQDNTPLYALLSGVLAGGVLLWVMWPNANARKCPYCAEEIKVDAKVCRYCGRDVSGSPGAS